MVTWKDGLNELVLYRMNLPVVHSHHTVDERWVAVEREDLMYGGRQKSLPLLNTSCRSPGRLLPKELEEEANYDWETGNDIDLPGRTLEPGLLWRPRARITSTSKLPRLSQRLSWISPRTGEPRTWRPTSWPGPRPDMNSESWPSLVWDVSQLRENQY